MYLIPATRSTGAMLRVAGVELQAALGTIARVVALAGIVTLGACSTMPKSGPDSSAIAAQAAAYRPADPAVALGYFVVDMSADILPYFQTTGLPSLTGFGARVNVEPTITVGTGDVVQVTIFESGPGGLFIPADAGSRPGNFITLPSQTVDSNGTIAVPYAGTVPVKGRTLSSIQADIEARLKDRAVDPQVVVTLAENRSSTVSVLGEVNAPASVNISATGNQLLDVISQAGGISSPAPETYVTVQRGGQSATVMFRTLLEDPNENIFVAAGDTVFVNRYRRTYLAFGASGVNGRIDFEDSALSLAEAVGKAGGLLDERAEPGQVFVYRKVPVSILKKLGMPTDHITTDDYPVIFRANFRDPTSFFLAQQFSMNDKDILYVDNADSVEVLKFLNVVNGVTTTTLGVAADVRTLTR